MDNAFQRSVDSIRWILITVICTVLVTPVIHAQTVETWGDNSKGSEKFRQV